MVLFDGTDEKISQNDRISGHRYRTPQHQDDNALWLSFVEAKVAREFCATWLAILCRSLPGAQAAFLLLEEERGQYKLGAAWPDQERDLGYLSPAAELALTQRRGLIHECILEPRPMVALGVRLEHVAYPIEVGGHLHGVVVVDLGANALPDRQALLRQIHWAMGWLETLFRRRQADVDKAALERAAFAIDILGVAQEQKALRASALGVVNDLASRLACRRVSLGLANRRGMIKLAAISHSAVFDAKSHIVAAIENVMEEALDQAASVAVPALPSTTRRIALAHEGLARAAGIRSLVSVEMTSAGRAVGVITLERDTGDIFDIRTVELLEATAALLGPLFEMKAEARRWVAGRLADATGGTMAAVFGPRRPGAKLIAGLATACLAVLLLWQGDFRVSAKAVVEPAMQGVIAMPFDGYLASARVRAGDRVEAGDVLATLDDRELRLDALRASSVVEQQTIKYADAMGRQDRAASRVAEAALSEARAQLALVDDKIGRASMTAAFPGLVISGDLSQMIGSPIEKGKVLLEIAPLDSYRVALQVDERDIDVIAPGQSGTLVLTGLTNHALPFTVRTVTPVANAADGHNTFRVEADLSDPDHRLRPGMEGIGKVEIDRRPILRIWCRPVLDWLRMTLWTWWP